jgi:cbb3-type cytochrome oxidase maturation protein
MYYAGWLFLVAISLGVSIVAFLWGLRSGQFSDQDRARFLPLGTDLLSEPVVVASRARRRMQSWALAAVILVCVAAFGAAVVLSIHYR